MSLLYIYSFITLFLNLYEILFYFEDWKKTMIKNKKLIKTTLFHTFITYPISLILTDLYCFSDYITRIDNIHIEIIKFLIGINIFDFITFFTHLTQHKYFYKYHKKHHELRVSCIFFAYYLDMIDLFLIIFPFIIIPKILCLSKFGVYLLISFNILFGLFAHKMYNINGKTKFSFHNYHHYSSNYNFGSGYPLILVNWDKLYGTYMETG